MDLLCEPDTSSLLLEPLKGGVSVNSRGQIFYSVRCQLENHSVIQIFSHVLEGGCPQCKVSGNVRCRNNPFYGPSWWTYCVHCGSSVALLQLPSYCLPTTCCTCLESSLKLLDLDPLTYDIDPLNLLLIVG